MKTRSHLPTRRLALGARLWSLWERTRQSAWLVPALLLLAAVAAAIAIPIIDSAVAGALPEVGLGVTTADAARTILSSIAGSMVTVAGVVFSITMVMFSIASSQFGTRVLRNRMRDRASQVAIGTLLGTSVYCLLLLRSVGGAGGQSVPQLSVSVGIALSVLSLLVVVYFLHDMANAIQAPHILASLARDLDAAVDRLFPARIGDAAESGDDGPERHMAEDGLEEPLDWRPAEAPLSINPFYDGYLQEIDGDGLLEAADHAGLLIHLTKRPGDFVSRENPLADVWFDSPVSSQAAERAAESVAQQINGMILVGPLRTPEQDVNCATHELAQVAVRALSPGINDPFTAMNCIDRLAAAMGRLAERKLPSKFRRGSDGRLRVVAAPVTFPEALAAAYNQIRLYSRSSVAVSVRLLEALENIARHVRRDADREAVLYQARAVVEAVEGEQHLPGDIEVVREMIGRVSAALSLESAGQPSPGPPAADAGQTTQAEQAEQAKKAEQERQEPEKAAQGEVNG